jgi:hypothetical protein
MFVKKSLVNCTKNSEYCQRFQERFINTTHRKSHHSACHFYFVSFGFRINIRARRLVIPSHFFIFLSPSRPRSSTFLKIIAIQRYVTCNINKAKVKQSRYSGPEGSRKLRFPDFMTTAQDGGKVVSLRHRPPLTPGNTPGTHFC